MNYFNTTDIPESVLEFLYAYEELFMEDPVKAFVKENSIYDELKITTPRYLQLLAESISNDALTINNLWKNQSLKPIHLAVVSGRKEIVEALLNEENISQVDTYGNTLLHYSCYWNYPKISAYLIAHDTNIFLKNREGGLAIHHACLTGSMGCLRLWLEKDAGLKNMRANNDWPPLFYSLIYTNDKKQHLKLMELLLPFQSGKNKSEDIESLLYFLHVLKLKIEANQAFDKSGTCNQLDNYLFALSIYDDFTSTFFFNNYRKILTTYIALLLILGTIFGATYNVLNLNQNWIYIIIPAVIIVISAMLSTAFIFYKYIQDREVIATDILSKIEKPTFIKNNLLFSKCNEISEVSMVENDKLDTVIKVPCEPRLAL